MDDNNPNLNDFNINDDFLNLDIEKIKEIIRNISKNKNNENQNSGLKDYIDFNEIFNDIEKKDDKDILPNFIDTDIARKVNEILDRPYSTIIYADSEKKEILARIGILISFFQYYSGQLRYLYKTTNNEYFKELVKRVLAKNDGYLNMALVLYKMETSIYIVKDNQPIINPIYQPYLGQNFGNQYQR
jgi:hypothetical protein